MQTYPWQTLPKEEWEIVLVDDLSTEDLSLVYKDFLGKFNLRHVRFDHTRHPVFKMRNPSWAPGQPKDWFHTPALTTNAGVFLARGELICLCHPEILHAPRNFELAASILLNDPKQYLFGKTYLGTPRSNLWFEEHPDWATYGWEGLVYALNRPYPLHFWGQNELYWYTSFLPKAAIEAIGGVDFTYLMGVSGEDDDFRDRIQRAGWRPVHALEIQGIHQDHYDEQERHRQRDTPWWLEGLDRNRQTYYNRKNGVLEYPIPANKDYDWTAKECIMDVVEHPLR